MSTLKNLGAVVKKYDSGNVKTNKGFVVQGRYEIGDYLLLDDKRNVVVQDKKGKNLSSKKSDDNLNENTVDKKDTTDNTLNGDGDLNV